MSTVRFDARTDLGGPRSTFRFDARKDLVEPSVDLGPDFRSQRVVVPGARYEQQALLAVERGKDALRMLGESLVIELPVDQQHRCADPLGGLDWTRVVRPEARLLLRQPAGGADVGSAFRGRRAP